MIFESGPWRRELVRISNHLTRRQAQRLWRNDSLAALEREVMMGAYIVRKLMDSFTKVPHSVARQRIDATMYPATLNVTGEAVDLMNWYELGRWFDFDAGALAPLTVREFCNQIIHSWVFAPCFDDDFKVLEGIFVSSDKMRNRALYFVSLGDVAALYLDVATKEPASVRFTRDASGQWVVDSVVTDDDA